MTDESEVITTTVKQLTQLVEHATERRTAALQAELNQLRLEIRNSRTTNTHGLGSSAVLPAPSREDLAPYAMAKIESMSLEDLVSEVAEAKGVSVESLMGSLRK